MPILPFLKSCHICGAKEGLTRCVVCNRRTCLLHVAGGKCHSCLAKDGLRDRTEHQTRSHAVHIRKEEGPPDVISTKIKFVADPPSLLADMYLFLGGRLGSQRCTTPMGALHLDQRREQLLFDRQVARQINAATFIHAHSPGLGDVKSRPFNGNATRRLAHDQIIRSIDLVCRSSSNQGMQVVGGDGLLDEIELNEDMSCPKCGSWREICLCRDKPQGRMGAEEYFRISTANRLRQREVALRMQEGRPGSEELLGRIATWSAALKNYR